MAEISKPDFISDARLQNCLVFLDQLRKRGVTNMFDARLKLRDAFPDLTTNQAAGVLGYWMRTFAARAHIINEDEA